MTTVQDLEREFWDKTGYEAKPHIAIELKPKIDEVGFVNFLSYIFLNNTGSSFLESTFLNSFELWKDLPYNKWKEFFEATNGHSCEYYTSHLFQEYLGISAETSKEFEPISSITFPDKRHRKGYAIFELGMDYPVLDMRVKILSDYSITLDELRNISDRLISEGAISLRGLGTTSRH